MNDNTETPGLRQLISQASSKLAIEVLTSRGNSYKYASPKTKRAWKSTAARRLRQLEDLAGSFSPGVSVPVRNGGKQTGTTL
jgi:hypothetical protein